MKTKNDRCEALLLELTALPTAAGKEQRVQAFLDRWLASRSKTLRYKRDRAGNLLITRKTRSRKAPILITAHLDHPGFVVKAINGLELELEFRGGVLDPYFEDARIELFDDADNRFTARITSLDATAKPFKIATARLGRKAPGLAVGAVGRWALGKAAIGGGRLRTNACDDLAAAAAALVAYDTIRRRKGTEHVGLLFTVAEEVGFIGAIDAAKSGFIPKDARLICLENSRSFAESPIGGGAIVRVGDRMSIFDQALTNRISDLCLAESTRDPSFLWQRRLMPGGACEATAFGTYGYQSTCLCLPLGNYHNMSEIDEVRSGKRPAKVRREEIALSDFHALVRMLVLVSSHHDDTGESPRQRLDALHKRHGHVLTG